MVFWIFLFLLFPFFTQAEIGSEQFIHQGLLLDSEGVPLGEEGTEFCFKFSLYDDELVGYPDTKFWPEGVIAPTAIMVKRGFFSADLGSSNSTERLNLSRESITDIFLQIEVANKVGESCADGDEEFETLEPRQKIFLPAASRCACTLLPTDDLYKGNADEGGEQCKVKTFILRPDGRIYLPEGENQMSGQGVIFPGESEVFISHNKVASNSKIIVTPLSASFAPLYIKEKRVGEGFSVAVALTSSAEINFDWIVFHSAESTVANLQFGAIEEQEDGGGSDQSVVTFDGGASGPPIDGGTGGGSSTPIVSSEETDLADGNESSSSTPVGEFQPETITDQTLEQ